MRHAQVGEVNQEEKEKEAMQELPESPTDLAPLPISRNKGPARCYFVMMAIVYFAFFVIAVVTLGSFGIKQAEITRYVHNLGYDDSHTCILFAKNEFSLQGVVRLRAMGVDIYHHCGCCMVHLQHCAGSIWTNSVSRAAHTRL